MKKSSNVEQDEKNLISVFAYFMAASVACERETGPWALPPPICDAFPVFPNLLRSRVLSSSVTLEATRIQCFIY